MKIALLPPLLLTVVACAAPADETPAGPRTNVSQPPELGLVRWNRDWELAEREARRSDAPILLVFQEVPG